MDRSPTTQLGKFVRQHRTDNGRRRVQVVGFLVAGVLGLAIGLPACVAYLADVNGSVSPVPGMLLGVGVCGLYLCVTRLVQLIRTRGEQFDVYEKGIVHRVAGTESVIEWSDIVDVRPTGAERGGIRHAMGNDFRCELRLKDGRTVEFTTITDMAGLLARTVASAVEHGTTPKPSRN